MTIAIDKIREVIGSGGKVIRGIVEESGAKVDINDDGTIKIASANAAAIEKARELIAAIVDEPEVGRVYTGKVVKIMDFGAFVNFFGKRDGLVHVSQLSSERVGHPKDILQEGQSVKVKLMGFDERGKVRLSMKAVDQATGAGDQGRRLTPPPRSGGAGWPHGAANEQRQLLVSRGYPVPRAGPRASAALRHLARVRPARRGTTSGRSAARPPQPSRPAAQRCTPSSRTPTSSRLLEAARRYQASARAAAVLDEDGEMRCTCTRLREDPDAHSESSSLLPRSRASGRGLPAVPCATSPPGRRHRRADRL